MRPHMSMPVATILATMVAILVSTTPTTAAIDSTNVFIRAGHVSGLSSVDTTFPVYCYTLSAATAQRVDSVEVALGFQQNVVKPKPPYLSMALSGNEYVVRIKVPLLLKQDNTPAGFVHLATGIGQNYKTSVSVSDVRVPVSGIVIVRQPGTFLYSDTCTQGGIWRFTYRMIEAQVQYLRSSGTVRARIISPDALDCRVDVVDVTGRCIATRAAGVGPNLTDIDVDLPAASAGLYYVRVSYDGESRTYPVMVGR